MPHNALNPLATQLFFGLTLGQNVQVERPVARPVTIVHNANIVARIRHGQIGERKHVGIARVRRLQVRWEKVEV